MRRICGFIHRATDYFSEIQRVIFTVNIHIVRNYRIEFAFAHFADIDYFTLEMKRTFRDAYRFDLFCRYGSKTEFLEFVDFATRKRRTTKQLCRHIRSGYVYDETFVFIDEIVGKLLFSDRKNKHVSVPHSAERSPSRIHNIDFFSRSACYKNTAHFYSIQNKISLPVCHICFQLLICFKSITNTVLCQVKIFS